MDFVVVSYNVRHQGLDDGPDDWATRRDPVLDRIRAAAPEIIGLQESTGEQQADIAAGLEHRWHGVADEPGSGEHNPVGVDARFQTEEAGTEWLSPTPGEPSVGWDAAYPRVLTRVRLEDTRTGRSLAVYNAHFDHLGPESRRQSASRIRQRVAALPAGTDAIVLGDLNCRPGSEPYEILIAEDAERRLRDPRTAATSVAGPETTVTDFETLEPGRRLDHVLVTSGLTVERYRIDATTVGGRYPSDHLPVVVTLGFA